MKKLLCMFLSCAILVLGIGNLAVQPVALADATASLLFLTLPGIKLPQIPIPTIKLITPKPTFKLPDLVLPTLKIPKLPTPTPKPTIKIPLKTLPPFKTLKPILPTAKPPEPTDKPTAKPTKKPEPKSTTENVVDLTITLELVFGTYTGTYTGMMMDGLPHGEGTFSSAEEDGLEWMYSGAWEKGHMVGQGYTAWADGYMHVGGYLDDMYNGDGELYQEEALLFKGEFVDDYENGIGMQYDIYGNLMFAGMFQNGSPYESMEERKIRTAGFKQLCKKVSYSKYKDGDEEYLGAKIKLTGTVLQVYDVNEGFEQYCDMLIYEQGIDSRIVKILYELAYDQPPFMENDEITIWGTMDGLYSYTSEEGNDLTVPVIQAWIVE